MERCEKCGEILVDQADLAAHVAEDHRTQEAARPAAVPAGLRLSAAPTPAWVEREHHEQVDHERPHRDAPAGWAAIDRAEPAPMPREIRIDPGLWTPEPAPRARRVRFGVPLAILAASVAVLVVAGAVVFFRKGHTTQRVAGAPPTRSTLPPAQPAPVGLGGQSGGGQSGAGAGPMIPAAGDDAAILRFLTNRLNTLGPGYSLAVAPGPTVIAQDSGVCHTPLRDGPNTTWYTDWERPAGDGVVDIGIEVTAAASADVLTRERAYFASRDYLDCLRQHATDDVTRDYGPDHSAVQVDVGPVDPPVRGAADEFRTTTAFTVGTAHHDETWLVMHLYAGRFVVKVSVSTCGCGQAVPPDDVQRVVNEMADRLSVVPTA